MPEADYTRHSAATAVTPPSTREPSLRQGWGSSGASGRPDRLMQHVQSDEADVGSLVAALGAVALVLIAAGAMVVAFAF